MRRITLFLCAVLAFLGASSTANAAAYSGHIVSYFLSGPTNMPFRVYLDIDTPACPAKMFYVDFNHPNYQAYVSGLITAYSLNKTVIISYTTGQGGYCLIQEYQVVN
jgi:hypothetical protein